MRKGSEKVIFDFFKKPKIFEVDQNGNVKKSGKKTKLLIYIIIAAICVLAVSGTGGRVRNTQTETHSEATFEYDEYIKQLEVRLEEALKCVKGAGNVKAMVTVSEYGEKVLAADKKKETESEYENDKSSQSTTEEQAAVIYGSGSNETPFVLKEKLPLPSGVLIIADGADNESVKLEIYEAVKALYGISGHRIKVTQGKAE